MKKNQLSNGAAERGRDSGWMVKAQEVISEKVTIGKKLQSVLLSPERFLNIPQSRPHARPIKSEFLELGLAINSTLCNLPKCL